MQASGSDSFVYRNTQLVGGAGGTQTPFVFFNKGDNVRGRVRYYNAYGQGEWSSFSNTVAIALPDAQADQRKVSGKVPMLCFLHLC